MIFVSLGLAIIQALLYSMRLFSRSIHVYLSLELRRIVPKRLFHTRFQVLQFVLLARHQSRQKTSVGKVDPNGLSIHTHDIVQTCIAVQNPTPVQGLERVQNGLRNKIRIMLPNLRQQQGSREPILQNGKSVFFDTHDLVGALTMCLVHNDAFSFQPLHAITTSIDNLERHKSAIGTSGGAEHKTKCPGTKKGIGSHSHVEFLACRRQSLGEWALANKIAKKTRRTLIPPLECSHIRNTSLHDSNEPALSLVKQDQPCSFSTILAKAQVGSIVDHLPKTFVVDGNFCFTSESDRVAQFPVRKDTILVGVFFPHLVQYCISGMERFFAASDCGVADEQVGFFVVRRSFRSGLNPFVLLRIENRKFDVAIAENLFEMRGNKRNNLMLIFQLGQGFQFLR
mmetsp:Transcript_15096/g.33023  ORF Transcript_15096/g.33023 Transcript_15096/m.33023 type:complete len:397 (-) Transcript_15096:265-1455(-)